MRSLNFIRMLLPVLFIILTTEATVSCVQAESQAELAVLKTDKGSISFLEDNSALTIKFQNQLSCDAESIKNPDRVLIKCKGDFIHSSKPLILKGSKIAQRARFGYNDGYSRIAIDIIGAAPIIKQSLSPIGAPVIRLQLKESAETVNNAVTIPAENVKAVIAPTPQAVLQDKATPVPTKFSIAPLSKANVIVANPQPKILHGETVLFSILFTKSKELKKPSILINLQSKAKADLKQDSPTQYTLNISGARIVSPIFFQPQKAPSDLAPFVRVIAREVEVPDKPVDLAIKIELSKSATLTLKQNAGDIEVIAN